MATTKTDMQHFTIGAWVAHLKDPGRTTPDHHVVTELEKVASRNRAVAQDILTELRNSGLPKPLIRRLGQAVAA